MTLGFITLAVLAYFGTVAYLVDKKLREDRAADPDPQMTEWLRTHPRRRRIPFIDD